MNAQKMTSFPICDLDAARARLGNDLQLLREMIGFYLEDYSALLVRMEDAADAGDPIAVARAAHSLKGLAANFDAQRVVSAADNVVYVARTRAATAPHAEIAKLADAADELADHLATVMEDDSES